MGRLPIACCRAAVDARRPLCAAFIPAVATVEELASGPPNRGSAAGRQAPHRGQRQRARARYQLFAARPSRNSKALRCPAGLLDTWGGTFENLGRPASVWMIVVPVALALVFTLLFAMFGNVRDGLIIHRHSVCVDGGIAALWLRWHSAVHFWRPSALSMRRSRAQRPGHDLLYPQLARTGMDSNRRDRRGRLYASPSRW